MHETTFSTPGAWADGANVRFPQDRAQVIGGWTKAHSDPVTGVCRNILSWADTSSLGNIAFGTHSRLMVLKDGQLADITPVGLLDGNIDRTELGYGQGGYGIGGFGGGATSEFFPRTWSLATFGSYLMASPRLKGLYVWQNSTASLATRVTQAPAHMAAMLVTPERQVLAFGCEEELSGSYNPMAIRGCDLEDYTDWTTTDSNNAFEKILEGGARIVAARLFGSYIAVWTDTSVFLGQYQSAGIDVYRFDLIADNCGLAAPNAVVVMNQIAYWLTPDLQFYSWTIGLPPAPIVCPIGREFQANIVVAQIDKVAATSVSEFGEIWFHYPDGRDGIENSRALFFNIANGAWSKATMVRTAAIDSGPQRYPIMVHFDGTIFSHESGGSADDAALSWFVRSADQYVDNARRRVLMKGMLPDFEDQTGDVHLTIRHRAYPQATERTKGPYVLEPGRSKKDFLIDCCIASIEFSGASMPSFMRLGLPCFDGEPTGER